MSFAAFCICLTTTSLQTRAWIAATENIFISTCKLSEQYTFTWFFNLVVVYWVITCLHRWFVFLVESFSNFETFRVYLMILFIRTFVSLKLNRSILFQLGFMVSIQNELLIGICWIQSLKLNWWIICLKAFA